MKHNILALVATLLSLTAWAQPQMQYYLPQTTLKVEVEFEETVTTVGPFYQYAERYLGTKAVQTKAQTTFELKQVELYQQIVADEANPCTIDLRESLLKTHTICLNDKGLLLGINLTEPTPAATRKCKPATAEAPLAAVQHNDLPLLEEGMRANSVAKMAESAAKQIYRIREARLTLISGDAEQAIADLQAALKELQREENELVALFLGNVETKQHKQTLYYTPNVDDTSLILFRFSRFAGIVAADDLSGAPITLTIDPTFKLKPVIRDEKEAKKLIPTPFKYIVPGSATFTLASEKDVLCEKHFVVPQFGYVDALPLSLLQSKPQILFNKFGAIQSITK